MQCLCTEVKGQVARTSSLLPLCGSKESDSDHQAWLQAIPLSQSPKYKGYTMTGLVIWFCCLGEGAWLWGFIVCLEFVVLVLLPTVEGTWSFQGRLGCGHSSKGEHLTSTNWPLFRSSELERRGGYEEEGEKRTKAWMTDLRGQRRAGRREEGREKEGGS